MSEKTPSILSFSIIFIIILSIIAGFLGGIMSREYLAEGDNFFTKEYFIQTPKSNKDEKIDAVFEKNIDLAKSIIGIYPAKKEAGTVLSMASIYNISEAITQGLVLTSDGWVVSFYGNFLPNKKYVAITEEGRVFPINNLLLDEFTSLTFFKIEKDLSGISVNDFNVFKLGDSDLLNISEEIYLLNRLNQVIYSRIKDVNWDGASALTAIIKETEKNNSFMLLADDVGEDFYGSPVLNSDGELVGVLKYDEKLKKELIIPVNSFKKAMTSLLKSDRIIRPSLGLYYLPLNKNFNLGQPFDQNNNGVLIWNNNNTVFKADSLAKDIGLRENDIILMIENEEVNEVYDLANLLQDYNPGDKIKLSIWREGEKKEIVFNLK